ncbi:DDE-type integrase/transposase/recombinase, partial [Streptomyces sp. NPDC016845]|uniref:DDE-type integrase/transposase/recombinase n=1 Tax=Streptomyces sp. NPDC016845 TaxID=3364972 RepID=UPI003789CED0
LMAELSIEGVIRGQRRRTTVPEAAAPRPPDLVDRDFTASRQVQLWVADMTYVRTWSGWAYVAFVLDVFSRMIVGWQVAHHMRTELPLEALEMVLRRRRIKKDSGLIHHSDRGAQRRCSRSEATLRNASPGPLRSGRLFLTGRPGDHGRASIGKDAGGRRSMVGVYASALDGVARNPALPTPLLLRLLAFDGGGDGPPHSALQRAGLPGPAVAVILAHRDPHVRIGFAQCATAEGKQRARLVDDPSPRVRAALAYGPEPYPRTRVAPLPDAVCVRLLEDPAPSVCTALLDSPHLAPSFVATLAAHHLAAGRRRAVHAWEILPPHERSALLADPDPGVRRAAALQECRHDARLTAQLLRDPESAAQALRRGLLLRFDAERCIAERTHLAALAENPSLPADLVEQLAVDPDEAVRLAISVRPELDETRRMAIDFTVADIIDRGERVQWVRDGRADPEVLRRAAASAHPLLQRAAAQSPHLPADLLHLLARAEDPMVDTLLGIHHPDTPQEVLMRVYARLGGTFSAWMAETHPRFPREGLAARYADHPDGNYRRLAVRDPAATPALIERLSHDPAVWTRQAAAGDPRLPLHRLREALHVPELASSAGANPALPEDEMAAVLKMAGVPA